LSEHILELTKKICDITKKEVTFLTSPPDSIISLQQKLNKDKLAKFKRREINQEKYENRNAIYLLIEWHNKMHSIIIDTDSKIESRNIKYDIIFSPNEISKNIRSIKILPLEPISTFPFYNVFDISLNQNSLKQKAREYWINNTIEKNIQNYYIDYLNFKTELCLTFFPTLEYYQPEWVYGTNCYILYNEIQRIMVTLFFNNHKMLNVVSVKTTSDDLSYKKLIESFKKNFQLPPMENLYSSYMQRVSEKISFFSMKKHPFIEALEDIKKGIKLYNEMQPDIDFDMFQISEATIYNRTHNFINLMRFLYHKYDFLKYYLKDWNDNIYVNIGYYIKTNESFKMPDGSIILIYSKNDKDKITVKKVSNEDELEYLKKIIQEFPSNIIFTSHSSLTRYFRDKYKHY